MTTHIIVMGLASLLLVGLLWFEYRKQPKHALITKTILSSCFIIIALLQRYSGQTYYYWVLSALIFCFIGDILLALPEEKHFFYGLIAFLFGHLLYIAGFAQLVAVFNYTAFYIFLLLSALIYLWAHPFLKDMKIPVGVYVIVITAMIVLAFSIFIDEEMPITGRFMVVFGALNFYLSDTLVARDQFIKNEWINRLVGLPMYYAAQFLLAFSTAYV